MGTDDLMALVREYGKTCAEFAEIRATGTIPHWLGSKGMGQLQEIDAAIIELSGTVAS